MHASISISLIRITKLLLENYPPTDLKNLADAQGILPLYLAAQCDSWDLLELVRPTGTDSDFDRRDKQHRALLHFAAANGSISVVMKVKEIMQTQPKQFYELEDRDGWTPLHWAFRQRNFEAVKLLTQSEADLERKCRHGWTPKRIAIFHGNKDKLGDLLSIFAKVENSSSSGKSDLTEANKNSIELGSQQAVINTEVEAEEERITAPINDAEKLLPLHRGKRHSGYKCDGCDCVSPFSIFCISTAIRRQSRESHIFGTGKKISVNEVKFRIFTAIYIIAKSVRIGISVLSATGPRNKYTIPATLTNLNVEMYEAETYFVSFAWFSFFSSSFFLLWSFSFETVVRLAMK